MITKEVDSEGIIRYHNELGQLHQDGDEPALILKSGTVAYYKNNLRHRDGDLPAIIYKDSTVVVYCKNGQNHRIAGPAYIISSSGYVEYWIHGEQYTKEEFDNHPLVREYKLKKVVEGLLSD